MTRPTAEDPVARGLSEIIGGPPGRYAATSPRRRFWTPMRVVLAMAVVVLALGWVQKAPCLTHGWTNEYQYTHACYTDVFALYYAEQLDTGAVPYFGHAVEYPVLTGLAMEVVAAPARALSTANAGATFFDLTAILLAVGALVTVWAVARLHRRRPWDAAMVALAPIMVVTAFVNWDLLAVALATVALLAWARARPAWAGVLLGLGVAAKFYPVLFLGPLFVLCLRAGRLRAWLTTAAAAAAAWLAVDLPFMVLTPHAWARFFELSSTRPQDWGTFWYWLAEVMGRPLDQNLPPGAAPHLLNTLVALTLLACCLAIAALGIAAPRRPRLAQLVFLTVAAFLLTSKVWSQQYVLWLLPLAVLAVPRWRPLLLWQACELAYFLAFYYELTGAQKGTAVIPEWLFLLAAGLRAASVVLLCGLVVVDVLRPERDPVRIATGATASRAEADDPTGGLLAGAPDRIVVTRRRAVLTE